MSPFDTEIVEQDGVLFGPFRAPKQMLAVQAYDGHASIHDDAVAKKLGFEGAAIEGPTHFSQFAPLGVAAWGPDFLSRGAISAHFRHPVVEGETVQAELRRPVQGAKIADIRMTRSDGVEILRGTASIGDPGAPTALEARLATLEPLADPVILADIKVGMRTDRTAVRMDLSQHMGDLYPFSLQDKLAVITEPTPWYAEAGNPWGGSIVPLEMVSVLLQYKFPPGGDFPSRGPSVSLFADQEIRLVDGPVFVGRDYEVVREVVFLSGGRRTESLWTRSRLFEAGTDREVARMLLNLATVKDSYAGYENDRVALYG